jgi:hypothetical protein
LIRVEGVFYHYRRDDMITVHLGCFNDNYVELIVKSFKGWHHYMEDNKKYLYLYL